jgi:uncharacterized protein with HEPN domain
MRKNDLIRLRHMLDAAEEAVSFGRDRTRPDLDHDRMLTLSLVKSMEIIGEAATRISPEAKAQYRGIPWADIIGMRNRLIHAYFDIDLARVWDTLTDDLPPLIEALQQILSDKEI